MSWIVIQNVDTRGVKLQKNKVFMVLAGAVCIAAAHGAQAQDMGKLLATGGVSQVEGAGGGGLTPWALITSYGTVDSYGANAHATRIQTSDYALSSYGVAVGIA